MSSSGSAEKAGTAETYRNLAIERKVDTADYVAQAEDIVRTIKSFTKHGPEKAVQAAANVYIEGEERQDLREFSVLLLEARERYEDESKIGDASAEQRREIIDDRQSYIRELAELTVELGGEIKPERMQEWLAAVAADPENEGAWARNIMEAVKAQVAVHNVLQEVPGVNLKFDVENTSGGDLIVEVGNRSFAVAVKTGRDMPENGVEVQRGTLVVGMPAAALNGYELKPDAKMLGQRLKQGLGLA